MSKNTSQSHELPGVVATLLGLFESPLRDVRFPDADREALTAAVDAFRAAQLSVTEAEEKLHAARVRLDEADTALARVSQRALAYARVYAQDNPELLASLPVSKSRATRAKQEDARDSPKGGIETQPESAKASRKRGESQTAAMKFTSAHDSAR